MPVQPNQSGPLGPSGIFALAAALLVTLGPLGLVPLRAGDFDIVISEIHYHPPLESGVDEADEFLELQNLSGDPVNLSGWILEDGISFAFPEGAFIEPKGFLAIARDVHHLQEAHGVEHAIGNFVGRLSNSSDKVALRNEKGWLIDRVDYRDEEPWPENADGLGPSLEKENPLTSGEEESSWRSSILPGGTPGAVNSTDFERRATTLIKEGDTWKYRKGTSEPASPIGAWARADFNDASWSSGPSGFGYSDGDDATVLSDMEGNYTTVYIRRKFSITSVSAVDSLLLSIVHDDAFVAYLNGTEVARSASAGGTPGVPLPFDATAADTDDSTSTVDLASSSALRGGENALAIQALNSDIDSSDLTMIPTLNLTEVLGAGLEEPPHDLEVNEVFAGAAPGEGFVEIHNDGEQAVSLTGFRLVGSTGGSATYAFPAGSSVPKGGRYVVQAAALPFALSNAAQWIGIATSDGRFVDGVETRTRPAGKSWGRYPDGDADTFVLASPSPGAANAVALEDRVVIHEIQYHPPLEASTAEYIELHNKGGQPVNISGWRLDKGVSYNFSGDATIPAGGHLVVSGDPPAVMARYGLSVVHGPWSGKLSDGAEKVELKDALGNRVDVVHYADDGRWPASTEIAGPDGHGPSIELQNPSMENNHGSAWAASSGLGSPGAANSRFASDPAPVIRSVEHSPRMPRSTDAVAVTARVSDERGVGAVRLWSRLDGAGSFTQVTMADDGLHGDGTAGDGVYGATLAARADGTIVQFYVEATDSTAHVRKFPSDAPARVCLYQVDNAHYSSSLPLYRGILSSADLTELTTRDVHSDVLLDGTFIQGDEIIYNTGFRYRGETSRHEDVKSFRVQFTHDETFHGIVDLNLNAYDIHLSALAADFMRRADIPCFQELPVAYTLNRGWGAPHGGVYLRVEDGGGDFISRLFPGDDSGNLYRGRDIATGGEADLTYLGPDPAAYVGIYEKKTNEELNDYSDVIELTNAITNTSDADFVAEMERLLDVPEWIRFFAAQTVLNNIDGAIATETGEDYFIYKRPSDGKWVLMPWDQNETFHDPTAGILRMSLETVRRLVMAPPFVNAYLRDLLQLLDGPFAEDVMARRIAALSHAWPESLLSEAAAFVPVRQETIRGLIPMELTAGIAPSYFARSGDSWRFFRGTREPSGGTTGWTSVTFNDSSWEEGPGGFGYGDGDDTTALTDMEDNYTTVYIRRSFDLTSTSWITSLTLSIRYDDGFVAYLNGTEVARRDFTGTVHFDSEADDHEAGAPTVIDLTAVKGQLRVGKNVLALVGINSSAGSSDLTLDPQLYTVPRGSGCGDRLYSQSSPVSLEGTAPVLETRSVEVGGTLASYDSVTGRWHGGWGTSSGLRTVTVVARDAGGNAVASRSLEVLVGGASTRIAGTLATSRWTEASSPYIVSGQADVPGGATLTVDPGVSVFFESGASLVVAGTLDAAGTAQKPVEFLSATCGEPWVGLTFSGAAAHGILQNCELSASGGVVAAGSQAAVLIESGAEVSMEGCTISELGGPAVRLEGGSSLVMLASSIEGTAGGILSVSSQVELSGVRMSGMTVGRQVGETAWIRLEGPTTPRSTVRDCVLEGAAGAGIELAGSNAIVEDCSLSEMSSSGISVEGPGSPGIARDLIHDCATGVSLSDSASVALEHLTVSRCDLGLYLHETEAGQGGAAAAIGSSIVWGNGLSALLDGASSLSATYSDVEGGWPGQGNLDVNPLFVDGTSDFHLLAASPARGAGEGGEDMGAYPGSEPPPGTFVRGDANSDGVLDLSDALSVLFYLFAGKAPPPCVDAMDADDKGSVNLTDALYILGFLFQGGPPPLPPFPARGQDPTPGDPYDC